MKNSNYLILVPILAAFLLTVGCEKPITQVEIGDQDHNVLVLTASEIIQSDNGVIVDGQQVYFNTFHQDSSINFHDESVYRYHTQIGNILTEWIVEGVGLKIAFNRTSSSGKDGKFIFDYLDLGELSLNGILLNTITADEVDFGDIPDSLLEIRNIKEYWYPLFASQTTSNGRTFINANTPLKAVYDAEDEFILNGTNAPVLEDFTVSFVSKRAPKLASLSNGSVLDFNNEIPRLTAQHDLVLSFDQIIRAGEAYLMFMPISANSNETRFSDVKEKAAFASIIEDTDEIRISSEILTELKSNSTVSAELYSIMVISHAKSGDVTLAGTDGTYGMPVFTEGIIEMIVIFNN